MARNWDVPISVWLGTSAQALTFYGGLPQLIVPDNPSALLTLAERYEPKLTNTVLGKHPLLYKLSGLKSLFFSL